MAKFLCFLFLLVFFWKVNGFEDIKVNSIPDLYDDNDQKVNIRMTEQLPFPQNNSTGESEFSSRRTPMECFSDPNKGPCHDKILRWNYVSRKDKCIKFWYGGCDGNGNNFYSKAECEEWCKNRKEHLPGLKNKARYYCSNNGLKPHFTDCSKYIECLNQIGYIYKCPPGLHFNEHSKKCVIPCAAFCDQDYACQCKWRKCVDKDYKCPTPNGYFPFHKNCSKFIICRESVPTLLDCPQGHEFHVGWRICVPQDEAVCFRFLETKSDKDNRRENPEQDCPQRNGNFSLPEECTKYTECRDFIPKLQECPEAQSFDSMKKICVPWYEALCSKSDKVDLNFPEVFDCPESNGNYSVALDCTKYIECKNSVSTPTMCPRGQFFDSKKKICVRWYEAFCYHEKLEDSYFLVTNCQRLKTPFPCTLEMYFGNPLNNIHISRILNFRKQFCH